MPELPEVETIARSLRPALVGKTILAADLRWERTLAAPSPKKFREQIKGQRIEDTSRRAKYFILQLSSFSFLVHLRMSGDLLLKEGDYQPGKHDRLILFLASAPSPLEGGARVGRQVLVFNDPRKFGRVWLTANPDEVLGGLGPEPLDSAFTAEAFYERLSAHRRQLKPLLLDQTFLAGLGNIYADETLHAARLYPLIASDRVTLAQAKALFHAIRQVLRDGIEHNGSSIDWVYRRGEHQNHFRVYGRQGEPCSVCGTVIERITVGQRGTHFCPTCQSATR